LAKKRVFLIPRPGSASKLGFQHSKSLDCWLKGRREELMQREDRTPFLSNPCKNGKRIDVEVALGDA